MTAFESSGPYESPHSHFLARADERALELRRHELVVNCDDAREPVIDELLRRGREIIAAETVRVGRANALAREQILEAGEEAVVTLAMRLRTPVALKPITPLARELANDAIRARAPEPDHPPRLASRPQEPRKDAQPPLDSDDEPAEADEGPVAKADKDPVVEAGQGRPRRARTAIEAQLRDALRQGRIKPNNSDMS
ncbi:MAG: hypothetical protein ACYCXW_02645 [Solirubrobacteraceae bacterium]